MRACCGRGSKEGSVLASAPPGANNPAASDLIGTLRSPESIHALRETLQLVEPFPDLRGVRRLRCEGQVALEVGGRLGEKGQAVMDQSPIPDLLGPVRGGAYQELLHLQGHVEIALLPVDPLEVVDHPFENFPFRRRAQELGPVLELPLVHLGDAAAALLLGEELAAVEGIDEEVRHRLGPVVPHQEVSRERHARERAPDPSPDLEIDRRQGEDRKSTHLNSSHGYISYAVFCLKKKKKKIKV